MLGRTAYGARDPAVQAEVIRQRHRGQAPGATVAMKHGGLLGFCGVNFGAGQTPASQEVPPWGAGLPSSSITRCLRSILSHSPCSEHLLRDLAASQALLCSTFAKYLRVILLKSPEIPRRRRASSPTSPQEAGWAQLSALPAGSSLLPGFHPERLVFSLLRHRQLRQITWLPF